MNDQNYPAPVADVDADASHDEVDKLVDLGVEVRPVVDNIDVRMVPPRLHRSPVPLPRQLQTLEPKRRNIFPIFLWFFVSITFSWLLTENWHL
jgi:hypothetical protein